MSGAFSQFLEPQQDQVNQEKINCTFNEIYQILKDNVLFRCQTPQSSIMLRYLYSMLILGFIIPLCIICFCYGMIITKVRKTEVNARHNVFSCEGSQRRMRTASLKGIFKNTGPFKLS